MVTLAHADRLVVDHGDVHRELGGRVDPLGSVALDGRRRAADLDLDRHGSLTPFGSVLARR